MDKYMLVLFVSLEQELAIRELFICHNWSFTKQEANVSTWATKSTTIDSEPEESLDVTDLDWAEVSTEAAVRSSGEQEVDKNTDEVTLPECDNSDPETDALTELVLDTFRTVTEKSAVITDSDSAALKIEKVDDIANENVSRNSALDKVENNAKPICKRKRISTPLASAKRNLIQNDKTGGSGLDKRMCYSEYTERDTTKTEMRNLALDQKSKDFYEKFDNTQTSGTCQINKTKGKIGRYHCKECNYTFKLWGAFMKHKKNGQCMFECKFCGKKYTSRYYSNYLSHLKYHTKDRPYHCTICGKSYIEEQTLKIHMRRHTGDRPYICEICGKQFYCSANLLGHKNNMHSELRPFYQCDLCGAVLSNKGNLQAHKKIVHTLERKFTCEICGKSFKTQRRLEQVHAKVHTEVFPYKCDVVGCGKAFKRAEALTEHVRRHNNDRSHFCSECDKGFYCCKDLKLHMRIHTGEKPYRCNVCSYTCALAGNLRKHMKTHA